VVSTVVVQQRQRLFREGLGQLLGVEVDLEVVGSASSADELVTLCQQHSPDIALIEATSTEWDTGRLLARLRRLLPKLLVIGLTASDNSPADIAGARRTGMATLVSRHGGITAILAAVRTAGCPPRPFRPRTACHSDSTTGPPTALTEREFGILRLVGAGLTSREISARLLISHKTVENHKQRLFAKLGVQNQAHAVSVAMRTGLMRPDRIVDLALAD
jgi:DNA-binding NarL/FixJ family response regulator